MIRRRPRVGTIGAGRLARAVVPLLVRAGYPSAGTASRAPRSIERVARASDVVLIAVTDRAIGPVAREIARLLGNEARGRVFLHHAGAFGPELLAPLARLGAAVGVLHPLQVLGTPRLASRVLPGSWARIEGDPRAVRAARAIARDLGLRALPLPVRMRAADRRAYHAAASLVANDLVALLSIGADLLAEIGIEERAARRALARLAQGALAQAEAGGIRAALTGPAARGDLATLGAQLARIARSSKEGAAAHRALSRTLARLARPPGRSTGRGI